MCRNSSSDFFWPWKNEKKNTRESRILQQNGRNVCLRNLQYYSSWPNLSWKKRYKIHLSVYCLYHLRYITLVGYWSLVVFSFVAARRKAAEGKRRIKTEEEELAGMFTYTMHTRMISLLEHSVTQPIEYTILCKFSHVNSIQQCCARSFSWFKTWYFSWC